MPDLREYVDKKVDDRFRVIDEKLKNSFQAIKEDIHSIKSSLHNEAKETRERPEQVNEQLNERLDREIDKSISELKDYFKNSVSGLKKELNEALEKTKASKPQIEELKEELQKLKTNKKKDSSEEEVSKFKKIILAWKEKYKKRKSYERYVRRLKEKEIAELRKREYEEAKEKARTEREYQRKLEKIRKIENEEAKEKSRLERENQKRLEELDEKHKSFEERIIDRTKDLDKLYSGVLSKEQRKLEELKQKEIELLRKEKQIELRKINDAAKSKEPKLSTKEVFKRERKFFFTFLFSGLLILSIFSLFKGPFDYPGLTERVFWSLMILTSIIVLYYLRVFDFLSKVDSLKKEQDSSGKIQYKPLEVNNKEDRQRIVINGNKNKVYKKNIFSRVVDSLADK
jgi:hypothetical protein